MPRLIAWLVLLFAAGCSGYVFLSYAIAFARPPRPEKLLGTVLRELGAVLLLMILWPLWFVVGASYKAAEEGEGRARGKRRPVVLLHGFAMTRSQWLWLGHRLKARGLGPLYATTYLSPQRLEASARHLARFIEAVCAREDTDRVDVVAHSLGGVVARYYIARMGGHAHMGRLVTIGSPHKGTRLARFGVFFPAREEIALESALLAELGHHPEIAITSIWSRADAVVQPPESASVAPLGEDCVFDDLGHLSMLLSPRVVDVIAERLDA